MKKMFSVFAGALLLCPTIPAGAITMDGNFGLAEWAGNYAADDGVGKNGYVGPGYGGQAYDVEYLGLQITADTVYLGLQTGFDVKNGRSSDGIYFAPGDFALNVDGDPFYEYAIDFAINTTTKVATFTLYQVTQWQNSYYAQHSAADPFQMKTGVMVGSFTGKYGRWSNLSNNKDGGYSYVLEGAFDRTLLPLVTDVPVTLHWTMGCGNDYLNFSATPPGDGGGGGGNPVPEPGTFVLMAAGLFGAAGMVRRKRR